MTKAPFIYGDDFLPSEAMNDFLSDLQKVILKYSNSKDEEVKGLADRLEDFLQLGGPAGKNLDREDRMRRISGQ